MSDRLFIHPSMPLYFEGLSDDIMCHANYDWEICKQCYWACTDNIPFQVRVNPGQSVFINPVIDGVDSTFAFSAGVLAYQDTSGDYYDFSFPATDACNQKDYRIKITVFSTFSVPEEYTSAPIQATDDEEKLCCSYLLEFWNDCGLGGEPTVQFTNGFINSIRLCGNLTQTNFTDLARSFSVGTFGATTCAIKAREDFAFEAYDSDAATHRLLGYAWQHQNIRITKYGKTTAKQFKAPASWQKGRQKAQGLDLWEGIGQLVYDTEVVSSECC